MTESDPLDQFLAREVRSQIEDTYYKRINDQSQLQAALADPQFLKNPGEHVAFFPDHGVVHARDVAQQILKVLGSVQGVLIPKREPGRISWMQSYGVILAYVHDIGMGDPTPFGRAIHPEYATQAALGSGFDSIVTQLMVEDRGGIASRLERLARDGALQQPPGVVLRELIAMAVCHSKSRVPVDLLNDHSQLRQFLLTAATTDLHYLYFERRVRKAELALAQERQRSSTGAEADTMAKRLQEAELELAGRSERLSPIAGEELKRSYGDFKREGFKWLEPSGLPGRQLVEDVIDTVRALRCADALRQRGTVLKTSGDYEVFIDRRTANAIYAFRSDDEHLYLFEVPYRISAAEANLAGSEIDRDGNLRLSFHHGLFADDATTRYAAGSAALVVNDIQADAIESFRRPEGDASESSRRQAEVQILIEAVDDNPGFAELVRLELSQLNPAAAARSRVVSSLAATSAMERAHYLGGILVDWDADRRLEILDKVAQSGHRVAGIDTAQAFEGVRQIRLQAGETLVEAGAPSGIVYIAEGEGLRGLPLGGYHAFAIRPWVPVGVTGVVRGAARNATVVADQDVALLAIPKDVYLKHWHRTYDASAFAALFSS